MDVREKLVELLYNSPQLDVLGGLSYYEEAADYLIAHGITVQEWIPVSERLPEEWVDVLVLSKYDFCEVAVYLGIPGKWRITWNHDRFEVDSITHWMPLPQPPKGE